MYCIYCGNPVEPEAQQCPACGMDVVLPPAEPRPRRRRLRYILFPLLLTAALLLAAVFLWPGPTPDDGTVSSGCFDILDGAVTFVPERFSGDRVLLVPEQIGGQTVTSVAPEGFAGCDSLTTVVLPDTVTSIGEGAFSGCTALRGLLVPDGVTFIGRDAFRGCTALESLYLPRTLTSVGPDAFTGCYCLRYVFFYGLYEDWYAMYSGYISPFTYIVSLDGNYRHGAATP